MATKIKTSVYLPTSLVEEFDKIEFTKSERNHALRFLEILTYRSTRTHGFIDSYVEISSKYFRKVFTSKYLTWLNKLVDNNIISKNSSYYINNYSISYSINIYPNSTLSLPFLLPLFEKMSYKSVSYEYKISQKTDKEKSIKNMVIEDFKKLKMDWGKLKNLASEMINSVDIKVYRINEQIEKTNISVITFDARGKDKKPFWISRDKAIELANSRNELLIEDNGRFYICDAFFFTLRKKMAMHVSYKSSIEKMEKGIYFANRNDTNFRLDTNLTNMPSKFTDIICKENGLVQLDLCNSQFAILSNELEGKLFTEDFEAFKKHSYDGSLYNYIKEELNTKTEKEAKVMMFELMFSKEGLNSPKKIMLKSLFPSVIEEVDAYKRKTTYADFAVMLQKKESEIFIDGLWSKLKSKNIFCLTKHDSLIVKEKDEMLVRSIVEDYFNKINFKGKIR